MYGGLKKSASRLALVAAAGVLSTNAFAADLGGDCCADLEERVAELEATTARKGTRKTSLEIWGQVNKVIVAWNDGINRNTVLGEDNVNASTRFGLRGMAKVSPALSAGYSIVVEVATGGRSTNIGQFQDKAAAGGTTGTGSFNSAFGTNDQAITARESNFWIENPTVGRVTLGRFVSGNFAGPSGAIDLGGIGLTVASGSMSLIGTGLLFRTNGAAVAPAAAGTGNYSRYNIGNTTDSAGEYGTRGNGIAYSSPTLAGFTVSVSAEGATQADGQCANATCTSNEGYGLQYGGLIKYAGEFSGFRLAASAGYEQSNSENNTSMTATNGTSLRPKSSDSGVSLSVLHVPTGLFAHGFYNTYTRGHDLYVTATGAASAYNTNGTTSDTARQWMLQAGITKNWFGVGNTSLYGEYGRVQNGFNTFGLERAADTLVTGVAGGTAYTGDVTSLNMYGLGIVQNLDAAATELYAGYRNFSLTSGNCSTAGGCQAIGMFTAGARIKF